MLLELRVRNFAVLEDVHVEFGAGLNLLTGETGAGKSILIDALGAVLGKRVGGDVVRAGASDARIEAVFDVAHGARVRLAAEAAGVAVDDGRLILIREVGGRGRAYANGTPITVATLRDIGQSLVEVHGQHEGHRLLEPRAHLELLDVYGGEAAATAKAAVADAHARWTALRAALAALEGDARDRAHRLDLLRFQAREIEGARLTDGEMEALQGERRRLLNAERIAEAAARAYVELYENEGVSASESVGRAAAALRQAAQWDPSAEALAASVGALAEGIADAAHDVRRVVDAAEADPARLEAAETRLALLRALTLKYGDTINDVISYGERASREAEELETADLRRVELESSLRVDEHALAAAAEALTAIRRKTAARMEKAIASVLRDLAMPHVRFGVALGTREDVDGLSRGDGRVAIGPNGWDRAEFQLGAIPGEPPRPLQRVASGGELSRVMLAVQTALAAVDPVPVIVFDEVDAGVGGRTGGVIGAHLAGIAKRAQVLCVTHLPQVAAFADHHFQIWKREERGRARTVVVTLDRSRRVEEIARMLGGEEPTPVARRHAEELLARAGASD